MLVLDLTLQAPQKIKRIAEGFHVKPMADALERHAGLWNANRARTESPDSPHHGVDDIWCRFAPAGAGGNVPHKSVWYSAADFLPIRNMADRVMRLVGGVELGGILITRIPAGHEVKPHRDHAWHASYYEKFAVQIAAAPGQKFCFEDDELETKAGDLYTFRNDVLHHVINPTAHARVTAIICIRRGPLQ